MKPGCYNCRTGKCYHIDNSRALELQEFKDRIEMLESAVRMLEERLSTLMVEQGFEPYDYDLSDEDVKKIKDWLNSDRN